MTDKPEDIHLNEQDAIRQVLGRPPGCLLNWGITLVFLSVLVLFLIAWFVKYPDVIEAQAQLITESPPIRIVAQQNGKLDQLLIKNNVEVKENQLIGILESTADWGDIQKVEKYVEGLSNNNFSQKQNPQNLQLGNLQSAWTSFLQQKKEYQFFIQNDITTQKTQSITQQIAYLEELNNSLQRQEATLQESLDLARKAKERNEQLFDRNAASAVEVENYTARYLDAKRQREIQGTGIINNKIKIEQLRSQIMDLRQDKGSNLSDKELDMQSMIQELKTQITEWKQNHLLTAAIAGQVNMTQIWSANQYIKAGTEVLTIIPSDTLAPSRIVAKALLPTQRSGKVQPQTDATIRLDAYPYQEFGVLKGKVTRISPIAEEGLYQLEIELPKDLVTTYNKSIIFQQEMSGTARIITEDRRVLERLFDKILSALKN